MTASFERRLRAEWELLQALAALNPDRLGQLEADDTTFRALLSHVRTKGVPGWESDGDGVTAHAFSLQFPVHFPAVPMEMFLRKPVRHPNVHPETGFVCLWDRHRVTNTVEHAVHKLAAMLDGTLFNADAVHVMQPDALVEYRARLETAVATPLRGAAYEAMPVLAGPRRKRLL